LRTLTSSAEVGSSAIKSFSLASSIIADQRDERELTYVLVSHDLAVIAHMCDRVLIMKDGRFIDELSKSDLKPARPARPTPANSSKPASCRQVAV